MAVTGIAGGATGTGFAIPRADDPVVAEAVRRLVEAYQPLRVYLFGSVARGDATPDSDYDFLVVVGDEAAAERQDPTRGYEALRGMAIAKDVFVWTQQRFDVRLDLRASFPATVVREGKLLYGNPASTH